MSGARSLPTSLVALAQEMRTTNLRDLFSADPGRATNLSYGLSCGGTEFFVDFSKQSITAAVLDALVDEAHERGVLSRRDAMLAGEPINRTENRAVTHVAMRASDDGTAPARLRAEVQAGDRALRDYVDNVPTTITHVVNLGIGGSDLGPALVYDAISAMQSPVRTVRFAANIDPLDLDRALDGLTPARTLFVVCSKSFGTSETLANARRAVDWLRQGGISDLGDHLVAVTARPERVAASGLPIGTTLTMPESVGGRYSLASAVGVSVALAFGMPVFDAVRAGMRDVDQHFATAPARENVALLFGLVAWWNAAVLGHPTTAVLPYSRALSLLPGYLAQLVMESNGKWVDEHGNVLNSSSPVVWGGVGTNAQHAVFQALHQGHQVVPCDFIGHSRTLGGSARDHDALIANMIAQSQALAFGVTAEEVGGDASLRRHRVTPGNRPSTTLFMAQLTAGAVGALVALYEHSTFVQGAMWGLNSFDQWGVELGKRLAGDVAAALGAASTANATHDNPTTQHDASTTQLVAMHRRWRDV